MSKHHHKFKTDDVRDDGRDTDLPGYEFDYESNVYVPVVGAIARAVSRKIVGARSASRTSSRTSSRGGGRSGASSRGGGRSSTQSQQQQSPYDDGSYDDGYGGYGPYYGQQAPVPYYGAPSPYGAYGGYDPSSGASLMQEGYYGNAAAAPAGTPYGYASYSPQAWSPMQQGFAYDPASGMMMPKYADDSGNEWDPNDPNSTYSRMKSAGYNIASIQAAMAASQGGVQGSPADLSVAQDLADEAYA